VTVSSTLSVRLRQIAKRVGRLLRMPPRELLTTIHVVIVLAVVELLIRWVPLPRLSRLLGLRVDLTPGSPGAQQMHLAELPPHAQRQLRCTQRVTDHWPSARGPCLRRSLVAGHLLRVHDPAVRLGTVGAGDTLVAHAWIEIENRPLETIDDFRPFHVATDTTVTR
jgi:hypothetical protein